MYGVPTVAISGVPDPLPDGLAVVDVRGTIRAPVHAIVGTS